VGHVVGLIQPGNRLSQLLIPPRTAVSTSPSSLASYGRECLPHLGLDGRALKRRRGLPRQVKAPYAS